HGHTVGREINGQHRAHNKKAFLICSETTGEGFPSPELWPRNSTPHSSDLVVSTVNPPLLTSAPPSTYHLSPDNNHNPPIRHQQFPTHTSHPLRRGSLSLNNGEPIRGEGCHGEGAGRDSPFLLQPHLLLVTTIDLLLHMKRGIESSESVSMKLCAALWRSSVMGLLCSVMTGCVLQSLCPEGLGDTSEVCRLQLQRVPSGQSYSHTERPLTHKLQRCRVLHCCNTDTTSVARQWRCGLNRQMFLYADRSAPSPQVSVILSLAYSTSSIAHCVFKNIRAYQSLLNQAANSPTYAAEEIP
ncbi:hypothetical protein KUCAC02_010820, partial [Chaenocephalus aceratus]